MLAMHRLAGALSRFGVHARVQSRLLSLHWLTFAPDRQELDTTELKTSKARRIKHARCSNERPICCSWTDMVARGWRRLYPAVRAASRLGDAEARRPAPPYLAFVWRSRS
eukprot:2505916-Pleurochrysis_carterae.AAC.1